jgi:hypothetical protein
VRDVPSPSGMTTSSRTGHPLHRVRDELQGLPSPIVVFNKSHSGSRFLARVLAHGGVFMGSHQNESCDALDLVELVQHVVRRYYPDYARLWGGEGADDAVLPDLIRTVFRRHLATRDAAAERPWGWKLCETAYILPLIDFLFPTARYIHLIRDGRDVAFCDHVAPSDPFWKKIYFNTDHIASWRGYRLTGEDYLKRSYVYNTVHWVNSVNVGRSYGAMLRERYLEVRYEALCWDFARTVERVLGFIGAPSAAATIEALRPEVHSNSIAKYRRASWWKMRRILDIAKPELLALGYLAAEADGLG